MAPLVQSIESTKGSERAAFSLSPVMRAVEQALSEVARIETPILLLGEPGTGKAFWAQRVHESSNRAGRALQSISCGAASPGLFGGAHDGDGLWSAGTLYLQEVASLNAPCQASLFENLTAAGDRAPRLISSSARSLEEEIAAGRFREDLFFRLNGVTLRLPPLRHRREDIVPLAESFLDAAAENFGRPRPLLTAGGRQLLMDYHWPGNLRELEKVMGALAVLNDEQLAFADLRGRERKVTNTDAISLKEAARAASREAERELILKVLTQTRWNRRKAANFLQISYKALLYKLKRIGIEDSQSL